MTQRMIDNTMRQRHLLILAMNRMRRKQQLARGSWIFAGMLTALLWMEPFPLTAGERYLITAGFALAALLMQIPFLRSPCPHCGQRYHGISNPYRNPDGTPPPCRRCGFDIDKHVTPY